MQTYDTANPADRLAIDAGLAAAFATSVPITLVANSGASGWRFVESINPGSTSYANPVAIGFRNDLTIGGDLSKVTGSTDLLSGNFTTTFAAVTGGPVTTMGGFQAGVYIGSDCAGITFNGLRGYVMHAQFDAAATLTLFSAISLILTNNAAAVTNLRWIDIPDTSLTPGGGSIANEWALYSPGQAKVQVAGLGRFGKLDVTALENSGITNGLYLSAVGQLCLRSGSGDRFSINSSGLNANAGNGARMVSNSNASATVPTLLPNQTSTTTGLGAQASGNLSLIASATEALRATSTLVQLFLPLKLDNAYAAGVVTPTGSVTVQDSTGTTYRLACAL